MEDIAAWERSLQGTTLIEGILGRSTCILDGDLPVVYEPDLPTSEFDEEDIAERAAQAEEAELWADLELEAGEHDVFSFTEVLDTGTQVNRDDDVDMT